MTLRCVAGNTRPVADAGPNRTVRVGDTVTLDGGGSTDADGDVLSYTWSLREPRGSDAALSDLHAVQPTFIVDQPGRYIAWLVVNDGQINSKLDRVVITTEKPPRPWPPPAWIKPWRSATPSPSTAVVPATWTAIP